MEITLSSSLKAWGSQGFDNVFCDEAAQLSPHALPLDKALGMGSHVLDKPIKVMLLASTADEAALEVKAGVFFSSVIAGCNCADDPSPLDEHSEYAEFVFEIDRRSGQTKIRPA